MKEKLTNDQDNLVIDYILFLLQEKRTYLTMIRTGIGTLMAQITLLGVLMVAYRHFFWKEIMHLVIPFAALNLAVLGLAAYLIIGALIHIRRLDRQIHQYKQSHSHSLALEE